MTPLMRDFETFVATDRMPPEYHQELLSIPGARFQVIEAGQGSDWVSVARHITNLRMMRKYTAFLSVLDDFYFFRIDTEKLEKLTRVTIDKRVNGIRLVREKPRLQLFFRRKDDRPSPADGLKPIPGDNPYQHSLSLSLWNFEYFRWLLNKDVSIWEFERLPTDGDRPLFRVSGSVCKYNHIVEKGRLAKFAQTLPGASSSLWEGRPVGGTLEHMVRWVRSNVFFFFFGYTFANRRFRKADTRNDGMSIDGNLID